METIAPSRRERLASPGLETHLGYWLRLVSNQVSGAFARALQTRHVSVAEWVVLSCIQEWPEAKPGELAGALVLTPGAVSKVLGKLERKNWITRRISSKDNRVQLFSLTRQGRRIFPELADAAGRNDGNFFDCLDAREKALLLRLLRKLADFHQIRNVPVD